jgi:cytochrome bd-type quinol oxidase subunit 1
MMGSLSMLPMCLHMLFCMVVLVGVVLFVVWAYRLKQEQLCTWVKWLLVVGVVGCLVTAAFGGGMMGRKMMMKDGKMMMEKGMMMEKEMMNGEMMNQ